MNPRSGGLSSGAPVHPNLKINGSDGKPPGPFSCLSSYKVQAKMDESGAAFGVEEFACS